MKNIESIIKKIMTIIVSIRLIFYVIVLFIIFSCYLKKCYLLVKPFPAIFSYSFMIWNVRFKVCILKIKEYSLQNMIQSFIIRFIREYSKTLKIFTIEVNHCLDV